MADHDSTEDGEPHARAAGIAAGGEEGVKDAVAVGFRYRIAIVADGHPDRGIVVGSFEPDVLRIMADGIVGEMREHDQRLLRGHADRTIKASAGGDRAGGEAALQSADDAAELAALILRRTLGAGELAQPLRQDRQSTRLN